MDIAADVTLDCIGKPCPLPVIEVSKAMRELAPGQTLLMIADDPGSDPDMRAWCDETGHQLVATDHESGIHRFWVRREG